LYYFDFSATLVAILRKVWPKHVAGTLCIYDTHKHLYALVGFITTANLLNARSLII